MLTLGSVISTRASGRRFVLSRVIGEGSEGTVYEATPTNSGDRIALKWYFPHTATADRRSTVIDLVERGAPSNRFLWPQELVEIGGDPAFGYAMPLRPERYSGLVDLLNGKVDVPFSTVCRLSVELADSFLRLHADGLCYRDISFGNVFFDAASGVPLICDNDNVGIDGKGPVRILGTRRFMAPEIVRREAAPSTTTDLYSLSVLLFYLLMMGHPLVGRREFTFECWDEQAESELLGRSPLFVFDPTDDTNAPDPETHAAVVRNWMLYPSYVRDLFTQAFTTGLHDAENGRVRESMWRVAIARLRDTIVRCPVCTKENFVANERGTVSCWLCDNPVTITNSLIIDGRPLALGLGTVVSGHHLRRDYDYDTRIAEVTQHPQRKELLGLRNLTSHPWIVTLPDGEEREVEPERSVRIAHDTYIDFGDSKGRIECAT
ncbi:MAG TPA: serine/threonine protein kinase [Acidimicrobiia bacterium]|nr:serine/threonine protein kinase [Acidimicrobiia bacterium]